MDAVLRVSVSVPAEYGNRIVRICISVMTLAPLAFIPIIVLFLAFGMGVALWQERKYGRKDDSPEE